MNKIPNIPTEDNGEVRSQDQYVIVSGYVPTTDADIEKEFTEGHITKGQKEEIMKDDKRGFYTVEKEISPKTIT